MYGPKKTPHFISKNQLLSFPNLAHVLKAQDQGEGEGKYLIFNVEQEGNYSQDCPRGYSWNLYKRRCIISFTSG